MEIAACNQTAGLKTVKAVFEYDHWSQVLNSEMAIFKSDRWSENDFIIAKAFFKSLSLPNGKFMTHKLFFSAPRYGKKFCSALPKCRKSTKVSPGFPTINLVICLTISLRPSLLYHNINIYIYIYIY